MANYDRLITLEDDIVTSRNFLDFINAGLQFYEDSDRIFAVSGYCPSLKVPAAYEFDSWNCPWQSPWGYGIWKKKYGIIDLDFNPLQAIKKIKSKYEFLKKYGDFFIETLELDDRGVMVAGDARFAGQMLLNGVYAVMPCKSKVKNIGMDGSGVHCSVTDQFETELDSGEQRMFAFPADELSLHNEMLIEYTHFMNGEKLDRLKRQIERNMRKIELLRKAKKFLWHQNMK